MMKAFTFSCYGKKIIRFQILWKIGRLCKQGRIHGNPVADGWAGAVMQKLLGIQKCDGSTDRPTDTARCRVACPRLKIVWKQIKSFLPHPRRNSITQFSVKQFSNPFLFSLYVGYLRYFLANENSQCPGSNWKSVLIQ